MHLKAQKFKDRSIFPLKSLLSFFITIFLFQGCQKVSQEKADFNIPNINIEEAYLDRSEVKLSSLGILDMEYVTLETIEESLIGGNNRIYVDKDYIYSVAFRQIKLFSRSDGKFIRELGHYGQDPEGYTATLPYIGMSGSGEILVRKGIDIYGLNPNNNEFSKRFTLGKDVSTFAEIGQSALAGFITNFGCAQEKRIVIFDTVGNELNFYPNHQECDVNPDEFAFDLAEGMFYKSTDGVLFKESFNDTLFQIDEKRMAPLAVFELGRFDHSYEKKNFFTEEERLDHALIGDICYMRDRMFFSLYLRKQIFYGEYDRKSKVTRISKSNDDKHPGGFLNDIDDFVSFYPSYNVGSDQLLGVIQAEEVYNWFQNNPEKVETLPEKLKSLQSIQPEDNPLIMIAKAKSN